MSKFMHLCCYGLCNQRVLPSYKIIEFAQLKTFFVCAAICLCNTFCFSYQFSFLYTDTFVLLGNA